MRSSSNSGFGWFLAVLLAFVTLPVLLDNTAPAFAQQAEVGDRTATGGAQTLEDIMARQRGEPVPDRRRDDAAGQAAAMAAQLGTLGGASDSEIWTDLRYGASDVTVSTGKAEDRLLMQDSGMSWLIFREGPLRTASAWVMLGMLGILVLFYASRGRIQIDGERTGITIERFKPVERFSHWLLAGSFILLAITGILVLFGRLAIPYIGHEAFATSAGLSKWVHNNVSWAFMLALVLVTIFWLAHNIPNRHDLVWLSKAGGLFSKNSHPPARKFNAGQKLIFWSVLVLGLSVSASGLSLLFPFEMPMFGKTFAILNDLGLYHILGERLPETLTPHAEMQLATVWHAIVAVAMIAIVLAHIYLGSVGMEGAYDAMGSGHVELQWAREHHGLWVEEVEAEKGKTTPHPAE